MLKKIMIERGYSVKSLADKIKISEKSLKNKMDKKEEFMVGEVLSIRKILVLNCDEVNEIFFK